MPTITRRDAQAALHIVLAAAFAACAPTRHDPFSSLGEVKPKTLGPLKALTVAVVDSENTKTVPYYTAGGKVLTFGTVNSTLIPGIRSLLEDNFKAVKRLGKLDEAEASQADLIAVIDVYGEAKRYGFGIPDFHWDARVLFLTPQREQLAQAHGESRKRSVVGGIIGMGGLLPTQMASTAVVNHAAEKEALDRLTVEFESAVRPRLIKFAQADRAPGGAASAARAIVSDVDKPTYKIEPDQNKFAVVVGVEKYKGLPEARYAERDSAAVYAHLLALGYPEKNVKYLTALDATRSSLQKNLETWLGRVAHEDSSVFFYFSGHGAPDPVSGKAYLVPWDGDPQYLEETAYPIKRLYETLNGLKAKSIIVALDSCFSGIGGRSVLPKGTRPLVSKIDIGTQLGGGGTTIALTASAGNQISGSIDEQGHGLFTYYLLKGLNGGAQGSDGRVTVTGLYRYLKPAIEQEAARENRDQTPLLLRDAGAELEDPLLR